MNYRVKKKLEGKGMNSRKFFDERQFLAGTLIFYKCFAFWAPYFKQHPICDFIDLCTYVMIVGVGENLNFKPSLHFFFNLFFDH